MENAYDLIRNDDFNENKYKSEYNKENYNNIAIWIRKDNTKVINKLNVVKSKNAYIIKVIEKDIEQNK